MITEDYVSFETAKLLKEKGFNVPISSYFVEAETNKKKLNRRFCNSSVLANRNFYKSELANHNYISCPTLQMAMKWLREVHNKSVEVRSQGLKATSIGWIVEIYNLKNQDEEYHHPYTFPTYEKACETAIKYCLEKLI